MDTHRAEVVCSSCGLVLDEMMILPGTERRVGDDNPSDLEPDDYLLPQIYFGRRDASGRLLPQGQVWMLRRTARTYNLRSDERGVLSMGARIHRHASQLGLPSGIVNRAIHLYRRLRPMRVVKKPGLDDWALSIILLACREYRYIISSGDLVANQTSPKRSRAKVRSYYNQITRALKSRPTNFDASNYVSYFGGKLGLPIKLVTTAINLSRQNPRVNANPECVAAAALYIAIKTSGSHDRTQKDFCSYVGLSEISLRHWMNVLGGYPKGRKTIPEPKDDEGLETVPKARWRKRKDGMYCPRGHGPFLAGYRSCPGCMKEISETKTILEDLRPKSDDKDSDRDQSPQKHRPEPASPQKTKRGNNGTNDGKRHRDLGKPIKKRGHNRKIRVDPVRRRNRRKPASKTKQ